MWLKTEEMIMHRTQNFLDGTTRSPTKRRTFLLTILGLVCGPVWAGAAEHDLVRGDPAAEAIIEELQALDPAAPIEVVGKHRKTDQVTG